MLYEEIIKQVQGGAKFCVDLKKKSLLFNRKYIIKNGECKIYDVENLIERKDADTILAELVDLFNVYYNSIPSERSNRRVQWFKALRLDELSQNDLLYGEQRDVAQCRLELYFLFHVLNGDLKWQEDWLNVFHKLTDKCLLLRQWF